jgi:hypothetical protein
VSGAVQPLDSEQMSGWGWNRRPLHRGRVVACWVVLAAAACAVLAAATLAAAAPSGSDAAAGQWISYFNTTVGSTCVTSVTLHANGEKIVSTGAQRTDAVQRTAAGTVVRYTLVTHVTETPKPITPLPVMAPRTLQYLFRNDGTVATSPGDYSQPPFTYTYSEGEIYPTLAQLKAGVARSGTLDLTLSASTATARAELAQYLLAGHRAIDVAFAYRVSPARAPAVVHTPAGTFHDLVGIAFKETGVRLRNLNSAGKRIFGSLLTTFSSLLDSTAYFARGVGPVSTSALGQTVQLQRCSG